MDISLTCIDYPLCRGVGLLLIRSNVLGNEAFENRNGTRNNNCEEIVSTIRNNGEYVGSLTPEQACNSMFNPKNQRFDMFQTSPEAHDLLYNLMGKDVEPRTDFIFKNVDFSMIRE